MTWVLIAVVVLVVGGAVVVAAGVGGSMRRAYIDRPDVVVPAGRALSERDLRAIRFSVVVRGYRMDEVDELLDRLAAEVAVREERIRSLQRSVEDVSRPPDG